MLTRNLDTTSIRIPIAGGMWLDANVTLPADPMGLVLFAHGSGSSRHSPRNQYVASELNSLRIATVLADLLTPAEETIDERSRALRFDIPMLGSRLVQMIDWTAAYGPIARLPIGLFGASTGAAAALDAAAARPGVVRAVVSRGGRPDLSTHLAEVLAPTLLLVGGNDFAVIQMNSEALRQLDCIKEMTVIPGATHLFEEPGTLEAVASAAGSWFQQYLSN